MIKIAHKKDCCGCGACAQVCPSRCISMQADEEGFLYPAVDEKRCIQCDACQRACPILRGKEPNSENVAAYAAYSPNEQIREASSSGGIFTVLADWVLRSQGVVFGAAFAEDFSVQHVKVEHTEDLHILRGSKYLQSRIEDTYREASAALEEGRMVLYSGTGCQIAGLKAYLKKDYDDLYTVDVLCHGVPSPLLWQKYLREQEKRFGAVVAQVSFRSKTNGWKSYSMEQQFQNGTNYCKELSQDLYLQCFLRDICLRPSCHSCQFKDFPRVSDLTIGDAWGIGKQMPDMDDDRGTSIVIVNSGKGKQLWEEIRAQTKFEPGDLERLLPSGADSRRSVKPHPRRTRFFAAMNTGASMEELYRLSRKTLPQRMLSFGKRCIKRSLNRLGIG